MNDEREQLQANEPGHEPLTISVRAVAIGTIALVALVALTLLAMGPLYRVLSPGEAADEADSFLELPAEPPQTTVGLNPNQAQDRLQLDAIQHAVLEEYAWLDEEEQVARIPIERAVQMIRERGLSIVTKVHAAPSEEDNRPPDRDEGRQ